MNKIIVAALMIGALALAGCQDKPKTEAPTNQQTAGAPAPAAQPVGPAQPGMEKPKDAVHGAAPANPADPHAGMPAVGKIPAGKPTKSGKVLQFLDGGQYVCLEVQGDDGKKVWVATMPMKVAKGDKVKYVDAPALPNFPSKTLKRTFDALVLSEGVEVIK